MRVSAKAEYACAALLEFAVKYPDPSPISATAIAEVHGINAQFLIQVLLQLKTAGFVDSVRGKTGGYYLVKSPDKITLADIINAVEDRKRVSAISAEHPSALASSSRAPFVEVLLGVWEEIHQQEQKILEKLTLAELLRRSQESNALVYQI